jgi:protocatechuate 3,4-dioxygenase beta subunit
VLFRSVFSPRGEGSNATIDSDADVSSGQTGAFTLASGQNNLDLDAGMLDNRASIGDFAWSDRNGNGIQDAGETGVSGVYVELYAADGTLADATTSDSAGRYAFSNVPPGDYYLVFYTPGGYSFGPQGQGSDPTHDSDANPVTGQTATFSVVAGQNQSAMDAALVQSRAVIGDRVWDDANGDGIQDSGEAGVAGATVRLYTAAGALVGTATTDSAGQYVFTNVTPGSYYTVFIPPAGYSFSLPAQGADPAADSDADPFTGRTAVFSVVSGETDSSVDAALAYGRASVGNLVWNDLDGDGIQDAGEQGLRGVMVNLYTAAGDLVGATTSGAGGTYAFANLAPGDYRLQVVLPAGYQFGPLHQGGDPTRDSDFDPADGYSAVFTLSAAQMNASLDASLGAIPTSVNVGDLVATPGPDGITLTWQSALEDTILGYNIHRQNYGDYGYTQLNEAIILAQHSGDSFGADYTWLDGTADPQGSYYYWLEVVTVYGSEMVGPVGVNIPNYPLFFPLIWR